MTTAAPLRPAVDAPTPERATTLPGLLVARAAATPHRVARRQQELGLWREVTWEALCARAAAYGAGFRARGVGAGTRVLMVVGPGLEAMAADLGLQGIGAIVVSVHPGLAPAELAPLIAGADDLVAVVEDAEQLEAVVAARSLAAPFREVLVVDPRRPAAPAETVASPLVTVAAGVVGAAEPGAGSGPDVGSEWRAAVLALAADSVAVEAVSIGTSGTPHAVALSHANLMAATRAAAAALDVQAGDEILSYLPPSHAPERVLSSGIAPLAGAVVNVGGGPAEVLADLTTVQPTVLLGVPSLWDRLDRTVGRRMERAGWAKRHALTAGRRRERGRLAALRHGRGPGLLAGRLSTRRVRAHLGLGRLRVALSALAPLPLRTSDALGLLGVAVRDWYGTPECCGVAALTPRADVRPPSVGCAAPGTELRLGPSGELLVRGAQVAAGTVDGEGWLATGDRATLDADGSVTITGRIDDDVVTAPGARVDARRVAAALEADPLVLHAVVTGDGRPAVGALLELDPDALGAWAAGVGVTSRTARDLLELAATRARVAEAVAAANAQLPPEARVEVFRVLLEPLTLGRELTVTRRVRRPAAIAAAGALVEELYR